MRATLPLPGMEDVGGTVGWDEAEWAVRNKPARLAVLKALRDLAGGRDAIYPGNKTILRALRDRRGMKVRALELNLRLLDVEDRLIERTPSHHASSGRKIRFRFAVADTCQAGATSLRYRRNLLAPRRSPSRWATSRSADTRSPS